MEDISYQAPKVDTGSESESPNFYAWAVKRGYTRINADSAEELWRDPQGRTMGAGQLVAEYLGWRQPDPRERSSVPENRMRWLRLYPTMALVTILVGAFQLAMDSHPAPAAVTDAISETPSSPVPVDKPHLGLTVVTHPNQLEIRWDPKSEAVATSERGEMKITDDGITESIPIEHAQLRDGYVAYGPKTNDVEIRLEVSGKNGATTSESVRSVSLP